MKTDVNTLPKQRLVFFVAQDINDSVRHGVEALVNRLASSRTWVINAPVFVDTIENAGSQDEDVPDVTIGGMLEIYSAIGTELPRDLDLLHLQEVEKVVQEVQSFSRQEDVDFEFELDGTYVGSIERGELDSALKDGLIGEWRRHLGVGSVGSEPTAAKSP